MTDEISMVTIARGIPQGLLLDAAQIYYDGRLRRYPGMIPRGATVASLVEKLDPGYALSAVGSDDALLGIATFADDKQGFWRPDPSHPEKTSSKGLYMKKFLLGRSRRSARARSRQGTTLLLEGVFVNDAGMRQQVGEPLLDHVVAEARRLRMSQVEVVVAEPNPNVKAVYERHGFRNRSPRAQYGSPYNPGGGYSHMILDLVQA